MAKTMMSTRHWCLATDNLRDDATDVENSDINHPRVPMVGKIRGLVRQERSLLGNLNLTSAIIAKRKVNG